MYVQIPTNSKPTFKFKKILLEAICMASEAAELASEAITNVAAKANSGAVIANT